MPSKNPPNENLGDALIHSVSTEGVQDAAAEMADMALDLFLNNDVIEAIPVFSWFVKLGHAFGSVRDRLLLKKVANFLNGIGDVSDADRADFVDELERDPGQRQKVADSVILLLERHESFEKSHILGKLFGALLRGRIGRREFDRLAHAVDRLYADDIYESLKAFSDKNYRASKTALFERFLAAGLASVVIQRGPGFTSPGAVIRSKNPRAHEPTIRHQLNDDGRLLVRVLNESNEKGTPAEADA